MTREYIGIHKNLHKVIQDGINKMVNDSHERIAKQEGLKVEDISTICNLSKENKVRWYYINMLKEGHTMEDIKKYDTERTLKYIMRTFGLLSSLTSHSSY